MTTLEAVERSMLGVFLSQDYSGLSTTFSNGAVENQCQVE